MKNLDFKEILGYFSSKRDKGADINPRRDWEVIIIIFALALLLLFSFHLFFLFKINNLSEPEVVLPKKELNKDLLEKAIKEIEKKSANFEKLLETKPNVRDPSS